VVRREGRSTSANAFCAPRKKNSNFSYGYLLESIAVQDFVDFLIHAQHENPESIVKLGFPRFRAKKFSNFSNGMKNRNLAPICRFCSSLLRPCNIRSRRAILPESTKEPQAANSTPPDN
jgi:hypothetical protein